MTCMVNAITDDSLYMIAPSLQQGFIDEASGELLAFGVVTFYRDLDHTQLKPVYTVSGPPDSPVFTELPNPLTLSAIGTFIDPNNGQDIIPWYKPYDENGNIDLYYITVVNAQNVPQFTRDHYPSVATVPFPPGSTSVENFIPNGQFLMHLNLPNSGLVPSANQYTDIAYGGWLYEQTPSSSSINYVTFPRYNAPINSPDQNPRYAVELVCTLANPGDANKDIFNAITDVNFMQGQALTYQFTAYSNDGNNHNVNVNVYQNFGTSGSPAILTTIATVTVTPQIQNFTINFTMPSTIGKTLGLNDDDFLRMIVQSPLASSSDIIYTDFMMVAGTFAFLTYPPTTPEQDKAFTLPASFDIPAYDGTDSGKFVIVGANRKNELGFTYQNAVPTGTIIMSGQPSAIPPAGYLYCDGGGTGVPIATYPTLAATIGFAWGSGINGFTNGAASASQFFAVWNRYDVNQIVPSAGTSGFTFAVITPGVGGSSAQSIEWTVLPGSSMTAGTYYTQTVNTGGPAFVQLFWFTVNGIGTIPSVSHDVARQIAILSTDTVTQVRDKLIAQANCLIALPDLRGYFPRFWSNGSGRDPYAIFRTGAGGPFPGFPYLIASGDSGDNVGSEQASSNMSHNHPDPTVGGSGATPYARAVNPVTGNTVQLNSGASRTQVTEPLWYDPSDALGNPTSSESRPINVYVNGFIKY